ncbi:MAG: MerR family transcriptional regulator [Solirubrobacteraceae bacterium]
MSDSPAPIGSYTAAEVAKLAGVSARRIGRWAREGIILPSASAGHPHLYSYADAGEALLAHYLVKQGKKTREIRDIVLYLRDAYGDWPLATAPLAHDGRLCLVRDGKTGRWTSVDRPKHEVLSGTLLNLKQIRESLGRGGWVTLATPRKYVEVDPDRHSGAPVVRGRRLPTALVASIANAEDGRKILRTDYGLRPAEIDDAIGYEADLAKIAA